MRCPILLLRMPQLSSFVPLDDSSKFALRTERLLGMASSIFYLWSAHFFLHAISQACSGISPTVLSWEALSSRSVSVRLWPWACTPPSFLFDSVCDLCRSNLSFPSVDTDPQFLLGNTRASLASSSTTLTEPYYGKIDLQDPHSRGTYFIWLTSPASASSLLATLEL